MSNNKQCPSVSPGHIESLALLISEAPALLKTLQLIADCDPPFHNTTKDWDVNDWQSARQQHIKVARDAIAKAGF